MQLVTEALIEPAVGAAVIDFVRTQRTALGMSQASVSARVEDGAHIRIVETGGGGDRAVVLFGQQLTIETFGGTLTASGKLMRETAAILRLLSRSTHDGVQFYDFTSFGAGLNSVDPVTKRARYSRTVAVDVRLLPL